jgi:hypothetical protein
MGCCATVAARSTARRCGSLRVAPRSTPTTGAAHGGQVRFTTDLPQGSGDPPSDLPTGPAEATANGFVLKGELNPAACQRPTTSNRAGIRLLATKAAQERPRSRGRSPAVLVPAHSEQRRRHHKGRSPRIHGPNTGEPSEVQTEPESKPEPSALLLTLLIATSLRKMSLA